MKPKIKKITDNKFTRSRSFRQLIKYGIVGVVGLIVDLGVYYLLVYYFNIHYPFSELINFFLSGIISVTMLDILISNVISTSLAVINNFTLNSYFTFRVTDKKLKRFLSFSGIATIGLIISSFLLTLFIGVMGMNELLAKAISVVIVALLQFIINKFFTFKAS